MRGVRRDVVEQPAGLGVLDVQAGQRLQLALVVAELDDLGLDAHPVAVEVGDDVELVDVEAEVVEALDAALDPPHLLEAELLLAGELVPQCVVALVDQLGDGLGLDLRVERAAGLQVEQLGEDVLAADPDVVLPHRRGQVVADLAGLGVDEVRREAAGGTPEQHVRERHVAPVETAEVQPHEQHDEGVHQRRQVVGRQPVLEQAAVGQGERQVLGEQGGRQRLAVGVHAAGHHALGHDGRQRDPLEVAQQAVLPERHVLDRLLDGVRPGAEADDPDHVPREAARERDDVLGPLVQRQVPRQRDDGGVGSAGDDPECVGCRHRVSLGRCATRVDARDIPTGDRDHPPRGPARTPVAGPPRHGRGRRRGGPGRVLLEPGSRFGFHEHPFGPHPWSAHDAWGQHDACCSFTGRAMRTASGSSSKAASSPGGTSTSRRPWCRHDDAFDTDDHGLDLIVHPDGRREWKDVEPLRPSSVTSGRMTGEEVLGVLHAAAEVTARLDRDERWWAPWDRWDPPERVISGDPPRMCP